MPENLCYFVMVIKDDGWQPLVRGGEVDLYSTLEDALTAGGVLVSPEPFGICAMNIADFPRREPVPPWKSGAR